MPSSFSAAFPDAPYAVGKGLLNETIGAGLRYPKNLADLAIGLVFEPMEIEGVTGPLRQLVQGRRQGLELIAVDDVIDRIDALVAAPGPANRPPPRR